MIGEILCDKMVVVLNKIDLFPEAKREASVEKVSYCSFCGLELFILV